MMTNSIFVGVSVCEHTVLSGNSRAFALTFIFQSVMHVGVVNVRSGRLYYRSSNKKVASITNSTFVAFSSFLK